MQNTLKLRELETTNLDMAKRVRASASEISALEEQSQREASESARLRSGAKDEEAARKEAQAAAEACEGELQEERAKAEV